MTSGQSLTLRVSVGATGVSSAATAGLSYLSPAGSLLETVALLTAPVAATSYATLEGTVTVPAGVASVRVVLAGFQSSDLSTSGTVTFDDVGLFAP